ncbi:MAG: fumarylacetoacetate hydrolase [Roseomonas sp.]|jgi:2-keto-4-pentenoate hydratase|nr:fumarylacetoacetate hydrolase [Roseomonas sp.]MCA3297607.1 fumarylacetoacetate hydrolase [Roseomonas sp.]
MGRRFFAALLVSLALVPEARAACPDDAAIARFAGQILQRQSPTPFTSLSPADGRCVQDKLVAIFAQPLGDTAGFKLGLTNRAIQQRFGIDHPIRGAIFHATLRASSGAEIEARFAAVPVLEADMLMRIGMGGVEAALNDHAALIRHVDQVIPFIELPDLVYAPDYRPSLGDLLAVNVGARLGVVGKPIAVTPSADFIAALGRINVSLHQDGREVSRAPGAAILGHPLNALAWIARDLARDGRPLRAGDVVSLGSFSPPQPVVAGQVWAARYEGLGETQEVLVRFK